MVSIKPLSCVAAAVLLLQQSVDAVPLKGPKALLKKRSAAFGKFLHITDIHLDPYYVKGADKDNYCHSGSGHSKTGTFGALGTKCDSPIPLVNATFAFLQNNVQDIDFILYTGDTVRHNRDDNLPRTAADVTNGHTAVLNYFKSAYNIQNVPFIPTIGNNDSLDADDLVINDSIYKQLQSIWQPLGLNLTSTFTSGGYFVQDVVPGKLTIINLNSMFFFNGNSAVSDCSSSSSPGAVEMQWLTSQLQYYSKQAGHQVYIMSHVPPIDDDGSQLYLSSCYKQYVNLLGQYGSTIVGHFNGHTNNDDLNAIVGSSGSYSYVSPDNAGGTVKSASMALFNAPSLIPVNNPALRVYTYDTNGTTYPFGTIRGWDQYYVDLVAANSNGKVAFQLEYSAADFFGVDHFDGAGVAQAISNIALSSSKKSTYDKYRAVAP